jgi:hypothetical protein
LDTTAGSLFTCTGVRDLPAGQSAPVLIVNVAIAATAPASITFTAAVFDNYDTNTGNNTSSVTSAVLAGAYTGAGQQVTVQPTNAAGAPQPITVTFSQVVTEGFTLADPTLQAPGLPANFSAAGAVYDITTTATIVPPITVCFSGTFTSADSVLHFENGAWVQLPNQQRLPVGPGPFGTICAQTNSLSPFVVARRVNTPPTASAGDDQVVEATAAAGAAVTLTGTGTDADGDALSFAWSGGCGVGAGQSVTLQCPRGVSVVTLTATDPSGEQGTDTVQVTVLDRLAPAIAVTAPVNDATYTLNQVVNASYSCTDAVGVATCQGPVPTGTALDTSTVGPQTFTVTATDAAGNQSQVVRQYSVALPTVTTCHGEPSRQILAPINADGSSRFLAGLPVLARFRVCGEGGQSRGTPGLVTSFRLVRSTTAAGVVVAADAPVPTLFGPSAIVWSPLTQSWLTLIDTRRIARRATHDFRITLNDGSTIDFTFFVR